MEIQYNKSPNFRAGLTSSLRKNINQLDVKQVEQQFQSMGVDTNFNNSRVIAGCCMHVAEIMDDVSNKYNLPFDSLPPLIKVKGYCAMGRHNAFCMIDAEKIFKDEPEALGRSLYFRRPFLDSPLLLDVRADFDYVMKHSSSPHFLSMTMHEWFHNIHLDKIYKKFGYDGNNTEMLAKYPKDNAEGLDIIEAINDRYIYPENKKYAQEHFGNYCMKNGGLAELFAEVMTQFTTKSIDENLKVIKNPLDNMPKDMPKFFKNFIDETLGL